MVLMEPLCPGIRFGSPGMQTGNGSIASYSHGNPTEITPGNDARARR